MRSQRQSPPATAMMARLPHNPSTCTLTPAPMEPVYACAVHRSEATYGRNVRGANGAAAAAAVNGAGVDVSASIAVRGDPARNALGTISNAKRVTSASLGTPQPYLAARSLVKYPPIDAAPVEVARGSMRSTFRGRRPFPRALLR